MSRTIPFLVLAFFLVAPFAQASQTPAQIACIGSAVNLHEQAIGIAVTSYFHFAQTAYTTRADALHTAYLNTDSSMVRSAGKLARLSFTTTVANAFASLQSARLAAETAYETAKLACRAGDPGSGGDDEGSGGDDDDTPPTPTVLFSDDFHRADSDSVGNGWSQAQVGSGSIWGIGGGRELSVGTANGSPWIYRTDINQSSGIRISGAFSADKFSDGYFQVGILAADGYHAPGYRVTLGGTGIYVRIEDQSGILAATPFTYIDGEKYAYEWDITAAPQNWSYVYVWNADTETKPSTPTLSWTNNDTNFTPVTSGSRFYILNGLQGASGPETMYNYFYKVEQL